MSDLRNTEPVANIRCRIFRIPLGLLFVYTAGVKLWQWPRFAQHVGEFGIVLDAIVKPVAVVVCCFELAIGIGILSHARWSLAATIALLLVFIAVLSYGMVIGLDIECGCFGTGHSLSLGNQLLIDLLVVGWTFFTFWNCSHEK